VIPLSLQIPGAQSGIFFDQYLRHFSKTLDFADAQRRQNQGF